MKKKPIKVFLILGLIFLLFLILYFTEIIPHHKYTDQDFNIPTYQSKIDKDNDGIDDQTDILQSAKEYLKTKPKYKSKYYNTGYPNDEYGVCTDVVAFALLNAGYDIKELLYHDAKNNQRLYQIETIDKNIDFRRVNNLHTYLKRHAISLSTDVTDIHNWQGGDIVVYEKHIGIVSDHRNYKGIPFLLHHAHPYQIHYEEDKLNNQKIIGHYRMS